MIIITSKKDGFRRCGIAHPARPTEYPDDRFTDEELAVLQAEPMLSVSHREADSQTEKPEKAPKVKAK